MMHLTLTRISRQALDRLEIFCLKSKCENAREYNKCTSMKVIPFIQMIKLPIVWGTFFMGDQVWPYNVIKFLFILLGPSAPKMTLLG